MATADIQRKAGDTVVVKGVLDGDNLPLAPAWAGALAKINIREVGASGALVRDHAAVTLDTATLAFEYRGATLLEGAYVYEIEMTFTDGTVLTFPNDGSARLRVVKAVG